MNVLLVPAGPGEATFIEKKSVFVSRVRYCDREADALAWIDALRTSDREASHHVYAYSIGPEGVRRFSDAGEPHGTAGQPVLAVFEREGVDCFLCTVTRYFGGILLGAGGLARAYAHAAKLGLDAAGRARVRNVNLHRFTVPYSLYEVTRKAAEAAGGGVEEVLFGAEVTLRAWTPEEHTEAFVDQISELSAGSVHVAVDGQKQIYVRED